MSICRVSIDELNHDMRPDVSSKLYSAKLSKAEDIMGTDVSKCIDALLESDTAIGALADFFTQFNENGLLTTGQIGTNIRLGRALVIAVRNSLINSIDDDEVMIP